MVASALILAFAVTTLPASPPSAADAHRKASLLQGVALESDYQPSLHSELRLTDDLRLYVGDSPAPLDTGGGVSSDVRQILALILGFIPGFGLGHLVAHDRNGFILFLIIDLVLYVVGGLFWGVVFWHVGWFFPFGGLIWLVVHIIEALDAYGSAGGPKIIEVWREKSIRIASTNPTRDEPIIATSLFRYDF